MSLSEQRQAQIAVYHHAMNNFNGVMTDSAKRYNQQNYERDMYLLDRRLSGIMPLVINELVEEKIAEIINGVGAQSDKLRAVLEKSLNDAITNFEKGT